MSDRAADDAAAFALRIDGLVDAQLRAGASGFADLLLRLPSVYPAEVLDALDRLSYKGRLPKIAQERLRHEARQRPLSLPEGRSLLPLPHPLDYEWRFTPNTSRKLLDCAADLTSSGSDILLFGTPGLAVEALALPIARRVAFLAEENGVTRRLIALNRITGSPLSIAFCSAGLPCESADAVVLDPPWYMDFIRPMLEAAAAACRPRGIVLLSIPPAATRPSADDDRNATVRFAARLGLELIEHAPLAIVYDTPFFESNALAAAGVHVPPCWRRGDLLVLRKVRAGLRPTLPKSGRRRGWVEVTVGRMRLFVRPASTTPSGLVGLLPLVEGDVLPTVSRRDPRRSAVDVWTSGNRVFRTDNALLVLDAALSYSGETKKAGAQPGLWGNLRERDALEPVGRQIARLAEIEAAEERGGVTPSMVKQENMWTSQSINSWNQFPAMDFG